METEGTHTGYGTYISGKWHVTKQAQGRTSPKSLESLVA